MNDLSVESQSKTPKSKYFARTLALVLFALIGSTFYLVYSAVEAEVHLAKVRSLLVTANTSSANFSANSAASLLSEVKVEIASAHQQTTGPIWWGVSRIPFLGRTPTAIRTAVSALDETFQATDDLQAKLEGADPKITLHDFKFVLSLSNSFLNLQAPIRNGAIELNRLHLSGVPNLISEPVRTLTSGYQALVPVTTDAKPFSVIAPALFGLDKPRSWMLVFQNGAEARAIGGFPGGWGILSASEGKLKLSKIRKGSELMNKRLLNYSEYVSADQAQLYGSDLSRFTDMNLSPDYPTNARLMMATEELNFGVRVDGVISMNEQALANLMQVSGSVTVGERVITSENVSEYVTTGVYQDYPNQKLKDQAVFAIIEKTFEKFQNGSVSPIRLLQAFLPATHDGNLHIWSKDSSLQSKILQLPLSGSMRNVNKPTAAVVFINGAGNKIDAYVSTKVVYDQGVCESEFPYRDASMDISLTNSAPTSGLPAYVTTRYDLGDLTPANPGGTRMLVYAHVPLGSVFESATLDGKNVSITAEGIDMDRQVFRLDVELPASSTRNLIIKYAEPAIGDEPPPSLWTQPMPRPVSKQVIAGLGCN